MSRNYHIWTIGCQMNEADSRHLSSQLEALGYNAVGKPNDADLVVLNTCVVRQQAEDKAVGKLSAVKKFKSQKPNMTIGLMGCMVGMREAPRLKKQFPFVDVFMPPSDTEPLMDFLQDNGLYDYDQGKLQDTREKAFRDAIQDGEFNLSAPMRGNTITAHVPIVLGCSHACTFCIIPYRRGAERSRPKGEILNEIRKLVDQGIKEVMLLGQIVDRYGVDFDDGYELGALLTDTANIEGIERVRFLTGHPNWMTDNIIEAVANHKNICPQFEVPVQAGNDEVLENMRRGYTNEKYCEVVDRIRQRVPDAAVHTDIIVGFSGETDEQFMDTYELIKKLELDKVHIAKYSERPKTIAARQMPDDISAGEKERRRLMLDDLQTEILTRKHEVFLNQTVEVLVEGKDEKTGRWRGRTPHSKLVYFEAGRDLLGQLANVHIEWTGPYSFIGKLA